VSQLLQEFKRICNMEEPPEEIFFKNLDNCLDILTEVLKKKGGATGADVCKIVQVLKEEGFRAMESGKQLETKRACALRCLPVFFGENLANFVRDYQAITEFDAIHHAEGAPLIASFGDWRACQAQHGIVIERELFNGGGNSFGKAVLLLLAAFYAFNIDYGAISNTMYFIQYELMKIDGGKVPLKVKSLLRELAK